VRHTKQLKGIRLAAFAALALCACVLLTSGVIYARYRGDIVTGVDFETQKPEQLVLWQQTETGGAYAPVQNGIWTSVEDGAQVLRFRVSNGETARAVCSYDVLAEVCMEASVGVGDPTWLYMQLTTTDEKGKPITYLAIPERIQEGTALYDRFGAGWRYTFYPLEEGAVDFTTDPLRWSFPAGQFTTRDAELRVTGAMDAPTLLRLSVTEIRPEEDES